MSSPEPSIFGRRGGLSTRNKIMTMTECAKRGQLCFIYLFIFRGMFDVVFRRQGRLFSKMV